MGVKNIVLLLTIFHGVQWSQCLDLCNRCSCVTLEITDGNNVENNGNLTVNCSVDVRDLLFSNETIKSAIFELNVHNNELTNLDRQFDYENLIHLDLSRNGIVHISDDVFSNLQKLETLILSKNTIRILNPNALQGKYSPGDFKPLSSLRRIMLDHNNINSLNADLFEHTERVEYLSLSHNPLRVIDTHTAIAITNLIYLKFLDLSYTEISILPKYFLHTPKYIEVLNLSGNLFTEIPQELNEATSLKTLYFNDNSLVNLTKEKSFPVIPKLQTLHLCQMMELKYIGAGSMSNLSNLEELYIAENPKLTWIDQYALATSDKIGIYRVWPKIKKLYLDDNQLTHINSTLLARWDSLSELDLSNNPWTCECENQWFIDYLFPIYMKIEGEKANNLKCAAPIEMISYTFKELTDRHYEMRCLDYYGSHPEKDAALLVGMLAGILIGIPIVLFCMYSYKRHWFGIFDDSPASFSRQFYNKTIVEHDEDY